ncbi:GAF domain-containing protein [candidate division TA06 bacterium]|nr:GAF domain-containing protein [candidate division TA06 bacterium]
MHRKREEKEFEEVAKRIMRGASPLRPFFLFFFPEGEEEGYGWRMDKKGFTRLREPILFRRDYNRLMERCRLKTSPKILPRLFLGRKLQKLKLKEKVLLLPLYQGFLLREPPLTDLKKKSKNLRRASQKPGSSRGSAERLGSAKTYKSTLTAGERKTFKAFGILITLILKEFWRRLSAEKTAIGSRGLLSVIEAIHSSNNIKELFLLITKKTSELFPQVDLVTLTIFKNGGKPLWFRRDPSQDRITTTPTSVEIRITDLLRRRGRPLLFLSAKKLKKALKISSKGNRVSSTLSIPITADGKKLGALHLESFSQERVFTPFDLELLQGFAHEASLAIERTRAHETLKKKATQLESEAETLEITYAQLMRSEKLASIGELAGSIAHEINNPLMTIMGRIELLLKNIPSSDPNCSSINIMDKEVDRISSLVRGLLQFTRGSKPKFEKESIPSIIEECLLLTENYIRNNHVTIHKIYDHSLLPISANRNQLVQVFLNLITNSVQSMKGGGSLRIEIGQSNDSGASKGKWIGIKFQDTGEGIPSVNRRRVFEPFFTTKENGTGLGLSISKRIIENHRGRIFIESGVHQGTRVTIQLPVRSEELREEV